MPAQTLVEAPDYTNEADNTEFHAWCFKKQSEYLLSVAEALSEDKKQEFLKDLELAKCTAVLERGSIETEEEIWQREVSEGRIHLCCKKTFKWIGTGDALTFKMFWLGAVAIAAGACTALERLEFLHFFCLGMFHAKMNKVYMDCPALLPKNEMMGNEGSLSEIMALAGFTDFSTEEKKISAKFEYHDQVLTKAGHLFIKNMFTNYNQIQPDLLKNVASEDDAVRYSLQMLEYYDIEYFFNPIKHKPDPVESVAAGKRATKAAKSDPSLQVSRCEIAILEKWDDAANAGRDLVARTIISDLMDIGESEEDYLLMEGVRKTLIPYFLNRKYKIQDSKYASFLLLDDVLQKRAGERDQMRMQTSGQFVNPSGQLGGGLFS